MRLVVTLSHQSLECKSVNPTLPSQSEVLRLDWGIHGSTNNLEQKFKEC